MAKRFDTADFVVVRTPLFPVRRMLDLGDQCRAAQMPLADREEALLADVAMVRAHVASALKDPVIREALFVASPNLLEAEGYWVGDPDGKKGRRFENSVVKYLSRMSSRCTPFGLFAGIGVGQIVDGPTLIKVGDPSEHQKWTRLDMDYVCLLCERLLADPEIRAKTRFFTNDSTHQVGDRFVYVARDIDEKTRAGSYRLSDAGVTDALSRVIERAKTPGTIKEIAAIFDGDPDNDPAEAESFVDLVANAQLLLPELWPIVSGGDPVQELIGQLKAGGNHAQAGALEIVSGLISALDESGPGVGREAYERIASHLAETLPAKAAIERLLQVDVKLRAEVSLNKGDCLAAVEKSLDTLLALDDGGRLESPLAGFINAFERRYEGREMPLLDVLDDEHGIGFEGRSSGYIESEILVGVTRQESPAPPKMPVAGLSLLRHKLLAESIEQGYRPILLDKDEIRKNLDPEGKKPVPSFSIPTFTMTVRLTTAGWQFMGTTPTLAYLGRFVGMDTKLLESARDYLKLDDQAAPGVVHAEIVHHPGGRIGNVLLRPRLRSKDLLFLGRSEAPGADSINAGDLLVSVRNGRVHLRTRAGEEVVPVLDNAHAVGSHSLGVYRFLHAVGTQASQGLSWYWGMDLEGLPHLPRVMAGNVILVLETWNISLDQPVDSGKMTWAEMMAWCDGFRAARGIPQIAVLADRDNHLLVDFRNPLSVSTFLSAIGNKKKFEMLEWLTPSPLVHSHQGDPLANELVIPLITPQVSVEPRNTDPGPSVDLGVQRSFEPGSEWLFLKVHAAPSVQDRIIGERLPGVVAQAREEGAVDGWFFIRYNDSEGPHLRVRFHLTSPEATHRVLSLMRAGIGDLIEVGMVHSMAVATYVRELERYSLGEGLMAAAEELFCIDSDLVAQIIPTCPADSRWRVAAESMVWYLRQFRVPEGVWFSYVRGCKNGFQSEYGLTTPELQRPFGDFFRKYRPDGLTPPDWEGRQAMLEAFRGFEPRMEALMGAFAQTSQTVVQELLQSYLHMHMDRLFYSDQRTHELAVYSYMDKAFESMEARKGKPQKIAQA